MKLLRPTIIGLLALALFAGSTGSVSALAIDIDFGDAPDPLYPTLLVSDGARHFIVPGFFLGASVDSEPDGQPSVLADGDDIDGNDDEDGVVFLTRLVPGTTTAEVVVTASVAGLLDAWIDFNIDGDWADPGEQIFVSAPLAAGANVLAFAVPAVSVPGDTFARFRFSTAGGLSPQSAAPDGEVEDYAVDIPIDSDGDGLSDEFEAGFGPGGITIINAATGNTASATGSAKAGSIIESGLFKLILPAGTTADPLDIGTLHPHPSDVVFCADFGVCTVMDVRGAILKTGLTKAFEMPIDGGTAVCIEDTSDATIDSVSQGGCPAFPPDPFDCPSGKRSISIPATVGESVIVSTKTPSPECAPTTYTVTRVDTTRVSTEGLKHTAVAILGPPPPVGGIAEVLVDGSDSSPRTPEGSGFSGGGYAALATGAAAAALTLVLVGWYARRRWLR